MLLKGLSDAVGKARAFLWYAIMNAGCNFSQALWKEPGEKGAAESDKTLCPKSGKSLPRRDATLPRAMGGPTNKL